MAIDWSKSMLQTFEYYEVDPYSWLDKRRIQNVKRATLTHSLNDDLKGSATYTIDEQLNECYIRAYLIAKQGTETAKVPLGTFLVQTPSVSFDGKQNTYTLDAYSPLVELQEKKLPIGYTVPKQQNIMKIVATLANANMRAPVIPAVNSELLFSNYTANLNEDYLSFLTGLIDKLKYTMTLSPEGRLMFLPTVEVAAMKSKWTYTDDNASILHPDISIDTDLYNIPNVVEVIYTQGNSISLTAVAENNNADDPLSIESRGRRIVFRDTEPALIGVPSQSQLQEYANNLLTQKSTITCSVSYTHGYCDVSVGDCVTISCKALSEEPIKAIVTRQQINCEPGTPVLEEAKFTYKARG